MVVLTAGFFGAIFGADLSGIELDDLTVALAVGLGGAFAAVILLALMKAGLARF